MDAYYFLEGRMYTKTDKKAKYILDTLFLGFCALGLGIAGWEAYKSVRTELGSNYFDFMTLPPCIPILNIAGALFVLFKWPPVFDALAMGLVAVGKLVFGGFATAYGWKAAYDIDALPAEKQIMMFWI